MQRRWPSSVETSTPGNDEETIDRLAVFAHQPFVEQVADGVAGVVIRDGEAVQALLARGRDIFLRTRHAIAREERVRVEVDVERHRPAG